MLQIVLNALLLFFFPLFLLFIDSSLPNHRDFGYTRLKKVE